MTILVEERDAKAPQDSQQGEDSSSWEIAYELSEKCYDQYAEGADTRLAKATREYVCALQNAALDFGDTYAELDPPHFMLAYHDNLSCDLHAV